MEYVIGALAGLLFGGVVGYCKNRFIWQRYLKSAAKKDGADTIRTGGIYVRAGVNYGVDILALVVAFFLGSFDIIDRTAVLVGTAVVLSILGIALALKQQRDMTDRQGGGQL